ncbi:MAG TPA: EexN family lipoprotein [Caulobacteraceae bacterium]|nr:EexN family lipoprotein [Caulobacteraceae bacterium]
MRAAVAIVIAFAALAGCSREPHSVAYFEANGEEAVRVAARCINGDHRGQECASAQAALASAERKTRMDRYQQSF